MVSGSFARKRRTQRKQRKLRKQRKQRTQRNKQYGGEAQKQIVYFLEEEGDYRSFSNWHEKDFVYKGNKFANSEQAFVFEKAMQFDPTNQGLLDQILAETDPAKVKRVGYGIQNYDDPTWAKIRYDIMVDILTAKFHPIHEPEMFCVLNSTGDAVIAEASDTDTLWGIGYLESDAGDNITWENGNPKWFKLNKKGEMEEGDNLLGKALMDVRARCREILRAR